MGPGARCRPRRRRPSRSWAAGGPSVAGARSGRAGRGGEDVGQRHRRRHLRPAHRLEVVVHGVEDQPHGLHHERQRVVVERIAAGGGAERLGVRRRAGQGDRLVVGTGAATASRSPLGVVWLHAVRPVPPSGGRARRPAPLRSPGTLPSSRRAATTPGTTSPPEVGDDHDRAVRRRGRDVGHHRGHLVVGGDRRQVRRMRAPAGRSTARTRSPSTASREQRRSQKRAVEPPPWIRT